jgi:hypothetical protein
VAKNHFRVCGKGADLPKALVRWPRSAPLGNMDVRETKIKERGHFAVVIYDVREKKTPYRRPHSSVRPSVI